MRMPLGAEQLQRQQAPHGMSGRDHLGAGQVALADHAIEAHCRQCRQEQKQAAELGARWFSAPSSGPARPPGRRRWA